MGTNSRKLTGINEKNNKMDELNAGWNPDKIRNKSSCISCLFVDANEIASLVISLIGTELLELSVKPDPTKPRSPSTSRIVLDYSMAPPSTQAPAAPAKAHRSSSPRPDSKASKRQSQAPAPPPSIHYTLLIRLPFPRGDFEDPPLVSNTLEWKYGQRLTSAKVEWDASKDRKLWKIISKNPKSGDIDCKSER